MITTDYLQPLNSFSFGTIFNALSSSFRVFSKVSWFISSACAWSCSSLSFRRVSTPAQCFSLSFSRAASCCWVKVPLCFSSCSWFFSSNAEICSFCLSFSTSNCLESSWDRHDPSCEISERELSSSNILVLAASNSNCISLTLLSASVLVAAFCNSTILQSQRCLLILFFTQLGKLLSALFDGFVDSGTHLFFFSSQSFLVEFFHIDNRFLR